MLKEINSILQVYSIDYKYYFIKKYFYFTVHCKNFYEPPRGS